MKESRLDFLENFISVLSSKSEREAVLSLYNLTENLGSFTRKFILKEEGRNYILHKDGSRELISDEQIKRLVQMSESGKLYSGSIHCHLHPITFGEGSTETIGYFLVDNRMTLEAEKAVPFIAAILMKVKGLKNEEKDKKLLFSLLKLIKEAEEFKEECDSLAILRYFSPFLKEVFSPKFIIIGARKLHFFEATAVKGDLNEPYSISAPSDISFLIGRKLEENNEQSRDFFEKFFSSFQIKPEKHLVSTVKFLGNKPDFFVAVGCDEKPSEESADLLDRSAALFLFLRKMKEIEESEKNIVECFNLVAKQLEIQRKVFNSIDKGILVLSESGKIIFSNSRVEEMLDITRVEKREKVLLRSKEPGKTLMALLSRVAEEGKGFSAPFKVLNQIIDLDVSQMEKDVYLVVCEDATSLYKEMEEKKHLFSLIAHEVKNPLASVLSASEMIYSERAGKLENQQLKRLSEIVYKNAKQMREILDDVSWFGKSLFVSGGEKEVSIKNIIEKNLEEKQDTIKAKEIKIWKNIMNVSLSCNPSMMETLISNLIGNALKYSFVRGNVGIRLISLANAVLFEVIDDGLGIPEKDLERIGEPFFRAENVKENISGTGFGLSIVKNIVARYKGEFKVLSPITEEDRIFIHSFDMSQRGAKFKITFPLIGGENAEQNFDSGR